MQLRDAMAVQAVGGSGAGTTRAGLKERAVLINALELQPQPVRFFNSVSSILSIMMISTHSGAKLPQHCRAGRAPRIGQSD